MVKPMRQIVHPIYWRQFNELCCVPHLHRVRGHDDINQLSLSLGSVNQIRTLFSLKGVQFRENYIKAVSNSHSVPAPPKRRGSLGPIPRVMASKLTLDSTVKLNSGYTLPVLGFGVRFHISMPVDAHY